MAQKKLQVFVSSTYKDLKVERQAAVQAILSAGHIPAGMELFAAGDQEQWKVIQRWIEESDVYLLILGARYGSLHPETQLSYTQMEYEYAAQIGKPFFAVAMEEDLYNQKVLTNYSASKNEDLQMITKLNQFYAKVKTKMIEFWKDERDIELAILRKMNQYVNRHDLVGWVKGNQVKDGYSEDEVNELYKEIERLNGEKKAMMELLEKFEKLV